MTVIFKTDRATPGCFTVSALLFAARLAFALALVLGSAVFAFRSEAQTAGTGALTGIVTDATGGAMSGASIQLTSRSTGELRTATTGPGGNYLIAALPPGEYTLTVLRDGFKGLTVPKVQITVAETASLNVRMEVGARTETVMVEATAEQLQTESSTLGRVTSGEQVRTLP